MGFCHPGGTCTMGTVVDGDCRVKRMVGRGEWWMRVLFRRPWGASSGDGVCVGGEGCGCRLGDVLYMWYRYIFWF